MARLALVPLVVTLAIAVAFNVVSVSVLTSLLERPFPYSSLRELVLVRDARPTDGAHQARAIAAGDFYDLRANTSAFESLAAFRSSALVLTSAGADPEQVQATAVTANFFATLGVTPLLGQFWPDDADSAGNDRVLILSRRLWQSRFGGDHGIVGREVGTNGRSVVVVAVIQDEDAYPAGVDAWMPLAMSPSERAERAAQRLGAVGRVTPAASIAIARAQVASAAERLASTYPLTNQNRGFDLLPLRREQYEFTAPLFGLAQAAALLVLLLALVNVTAVLVARWLDRSQELQIRAMLGAARTDLARLVLTETIGVTAVATAIGLVIAFPALLGLRASLPEGIARCVNGWSAMRVDSAALVTGLVVGATSVAILSAVVTANALGARFNSTTGARATRGRPMVRRTVMATQLALATALLLCAFVVFQGLAHQMTAFGALAPERLLRFTLTTPSWHYPETAQVAELHRRILSALTELPEIESVALIRNEPASNVPSPVVGFQRSDAPSRTEADRPRLDVQTISPSALVTLRIPVVAGRGLSATDTADAPRAAVLNEDAVRRFWQDRNPIGSMIDLDGDPMPFRIVGVVGDVKVNWYDPAPRPTLYLVDAQAPVRTAAVIVRTRVAPSSVAARVRHTIAAIDPLQPIGGLEPLTTSIADSLSPVRVIERLLAIGASVACLLAAIGVFGTLRQSVVERLREFGVRFALGATPRAIAQMVLREATITAAVGLVCGVVTTTAIVRVAGASLIGVGSVSASLVVLVSVCTIVLAIAAALVPAVRAARVSVGTLLRS